MLQQVVYFKIAVLNLLMAEHVAQRRLFRWNFVARSVLRLGQLLEIDIPARRRVGTFFFGELIAVPHVTADQRGVITVATQK